MTDAGISTLLYVIMILLFFRQMSESSSVTGLARVSRYPFIVQSLIDAMSFVGVRPILFTSIARRAVLIFLGGSTSHWRLSQKVGRLYLCSRLRRWLVCCSFRRR